MIELLSKIDDIKSKIKILKSNNNNLMPINDVEIFLQDIKKQVLDADYENRIDKYAKYGKEKTTAAIHYTNIIITAGYAGFFGLWSISKDYVIPSQAKITFIMISISLFSFVIYEVIDSALSGSNIENSCKALLKAKEQDNMMEKIDWVNVASTYDEYRPLWYYQFWAYSFSISVIFGLCAYALLIITIINNL